MFWMNLFMLVMFLVVAFLLEKWARKKWDIQKKKFEDRYVNKLHKKIEQGMYGMYFILLFVLIFMFENFNIGYFIFAFLIVLHSVRTWMEWKYNRESKEYTITAGGVVFLFIGLVLIRYMLYI